MSLHYKSVGILLAVFILAGCGNSGSDDGNADNGNDNPDMETTVEFAEFVKDEIRNTPAGSEPTAVNELMFEFNNRDNESAFDELFEE